MKTLVTGSQGFVGRHLVEYLRGRGFEVVGVDVRDGCEVRVDVTDYEAVARVFSSSRFDAVVHLAAVADIAESMKDPHRCFKVNLIGCLNVLEAARQRSLSRVVVLSSANYYGAPEKTPVSETD
ncbi:MAG: NAD-dependent epimerase/dehydratase family protein, partial [Candidatus Caldarchaeum sp.]